MSVCYDTKRWAAPPFSPTTSSRESATQEMHAYPLQPREGMEDGGFENEIILQEKSNVFAFPIEAPQDLDFFDQPKLSPEEIAQGTVRPENLIGSYAVYAKTKTNHRVGNTLYATGKTRHIYRPKAALLPEAFRISQVKCRLFERVPREQPAGAHTKASRKIAGRHATRMISFSLVNHADNADKEH
jgi:hypothetical protein